MPAWYDIFTLDASPDADREDMEGVELASRNLAGLVDVETNENVPRERIIIGGFSQGGAVAIHTLLKADKPLGGCVALSTYIPGRSPSVEGLNITTPTLQCHGESDEVVPFDRGVLTNNILKKAIGDIKFHAFPNMGHEATLEELDLLKDFIAKHVS